MKKVHGHIKSGADWIFQTDSDGQTNPDEFEAFWCRREKYDALFGNRTVRGDGRVCGYLDMFSKTDDTEKQQRYLDIMHERADMMKQLTEELFRYSVIVTDGTEMECENVFVNQLLAESISSFYPALKSRGIETKIELTEQRVERFVNKAALSRVFSNLLNNAVKYSGGDLEIILSHMGDITFSNTAKELSAVDVEQLFDRFYTVEAAHHSTGLGLSIARTLVERMGGTITAEYNKERLNIILKL